MIKPLTNRVSTLCSPRKLQRVWKALHFSKHKKCASEHQLDKFCMRMYRLSCIRDNERTGRKNINFLHIFHFQLWECEHCYIHYTFFFKFALTRYHNGLFMHACRIFSILYEYKAFRMWNYAFSIFIRKKHLEWKVFLSVQKLIHMLIKPKVYVLLRIPMILLSQACSLHTNACELYIWVSQIQWKTKIFCGNNSVFQYETKFSHEIGCVLTENSFIYFEFVSCFTSSLLRTYSIRVFPLNSEIAQVNKQIF